MDYPANKASSLTYLIEQITRIGIILFVSYALLVDVADKLDLEVRMLQGRLDQVEVGVVKALAVSYFHQLPFLLLMVVVILLRLVTLRGDRFLEPCKRSEVVFLKMLFLYMATLYVPKLWIEYLHGFARGTTVFFTERSVFLSELYFVLYILGAVGLGGSLFLFKTVRKSPSKAVIVVSPLLIMAAVTAIVTAYNGFGLFTSSFLRTDVSGFFGEVVRVLIAIVN